MNRLTDAAIREVAAKVVKLITSQDKLAWVDSTGLIRSHERSYAIQENSFEDDGKYFEAVANFIESRFIKNHKRTQVLTLPGK